MRCTAQHITLESPAGHSKWGNHLEETSPSSERWVWAAPRTSWTSWVLSSSLGRAPWWSLWRSTCCSSCWAGTGGTSPPADTCSAGSAGTAPRSCHICAESGNHSSFTFYYSIVFLAPSHLFIEQPKSDGVKEEYTECGEEAEGGPHDQELVPEPQQEVDLLVNDVLQQCQYLSIWYFCT